MTKEQAEDIVRIAGEKELEVEMRDDYSGRGMMGRRTYAVVGYASDIQECIDDSEVCYEEDFRTDSMGKSHSVYY